MTDSLPTADPHSPSVDAAEPAGATTSARDVIAQALSVPGGTEESTPAAGAPFPRVHLSVEQRRERGRQARAEVPRSRLGEWSAAPDRADPVALLVGQESTRVQELVPVRHARMAVSAFTFYRGSALVMASDLAALPRTSLESQLCGDAHLSNFGLFGAPDRSVVFDVNDFDETHPGPFEWDVKRLATSFVLAARDNGAPDKEGLAAAEASAAAYRESMANFAGKTELGLWYDRMDQRGLERAVDEVLTGSQRKAVAKREGKSRRNVDRAVSKARSRDAWSVLAKITEVVDGRRRFAHQPPLLDRIDANPDVFAMVNDLYREYIATLQDDRQQLLGRYEIIDIAHKVVGVGSVGLLAFALLMQGRDDDDVMVLQVKQAQASVLEEFTGPSASSSAFAQHGHRVVSGQRLMQAAGDSFLGWVEGRTGRSYYVRQLRDMKWSPDPATLNGSGLRRYAVLCGYALARAHARSGDAVAIAAYLGSGGSFDRAVADFSAAYADQVRQDYETFVAAIADGRIVATEETAGGEGLRAAQSAATASSPEPRGPSSDTTA
jgi:uncharacterized protein (DUF2252 family)